MQQTRTVTEGAMILSIYMVLLFISFWVPFVGSLVLWLLPIPFILYVMRHGLKPGVFVWVSSLFLTLMLLTPMALPLTFTFATGGLVIGEMFRRKKQAFAVLLAGSLTFIATLLVNFIISIVLLDIHPIETMQEMLYESVVTAETLLSSIGQSESGDVLTQMETFIDQLMVITPFLFIVTGIGYALFIQWIASTFLRRLKYEISTFPPLREWSFPKSFIWYYLIMLILLMIGFEQGDTMYTVVMNLTPLLEMAMIIQGFAFIFFYFYNKGVTRAFPITIVIVSLFMPFLLSIVRILGLIDLGFDLRKRMNSGK
ncbi:YybS family protein [Texcoconibacillus texcoconensis]|uniref:Uncharacterized protein YybS (DUF2232 family) n=1 Tax=Texcoconibacillus texcoconensis TaxID=1095777 RepID=A0A840QTB1_9BACI|nr:YybS family protein [Texcoconibacillus texcoconensis]MBB5174762.1 uncharacterized protein YybS (DUF2232 family) [Texcoconibacillus texcoconensis]